ncbi:LysE family translocator [Allosaccharopolyspora coralli]|uniref:LysE family translocator n=1 Tax=Allosaccharopolyspora coralli TaxID=2665642 RepID=A0A5Q3QHP4_9PSEU|nr:LysE family translocator [Allosaccharopolyspora coralli]QGK70979.1 LysE family translocator [Allosaccharopolyspora coralli]
MLLDFSPLPAFLVASMVVVLTPGVDVFLLLRTSLRSGIRPGLLALAGIHTASVIQVGVVISGLGALITQNPAVLSVLKWLGAAYLVYLAATILRGLWLTRQETADLDAPATAGLREANPYLRGFFSNITNPKMLLFSLAFLPQFVGSSPQPAAQLVMLGVVFLVVAAIWEISIVVGAARIASKLRDPRVARTLDAVSAAAFLTISVGLVAT